MAVTIPNGSQLMFYPMTQCTVSAGFMSKKYKTFYGYNHYGIDFDSLGKTDFEVLASCNGIVLGTEMNAGAAGGVVVVKYTKVYNPSTKKVQDLIARYAHLCSINVKKGQEVCAYQKLGVVSGSHKW